MIIGGQLWKLAELKLVGLSGPGSNDPGGPLDSWNVISHDTVFMNWNGGDAFDPTFPANINALEPEQGTVYRFITTKPNDAYDKFRLSTFRFGRQNN